MKTILLKCHFAFKIALFSLTFFVINSCSSSDSKEPQKTVYVAGYEEIAGKKVAILWKNGVRTELTERTSDAAANAVFVAGSDVYVVGYEQLPGQPKRATLWKNGNVQYLTEGTISSVANNVYVSGSDIYVVGDSNIGGTNSAIMWKNNIETVLPREGYAEDILVAGSDVYVCGYTIGLAQVPVSMFWKNNVFLVTLGVRHKLNSIAASGPYLYVAGTDYIDESSPKAILRTNNLPETLSSLPSYAASVFANGSNSYVAGNVVESGTNYTTAVIWKNGVRTNLSDGFSESHAEDVFVSGSDVYAVGFRRPSTKHIAYLWNNGIPQALTDGTNNSFANSIFIK